MSPGLYRLDAHCYCGRAGVHFLHNALMALGAVAVITPSR